MRTKDQLSNWRRALAIRYGPFALALSDEQVDDFVDGVQRQIDAEEKKRVRTWSVKLRMKDYQDSEWDKINREPTMPRCTQIAITSKCHELLEKYPDIVAIQISDFYCNTPTHVFDRG